MDWFNGSIIEAITASRQRKCLFVVVIAGEDEPSQQLLTRLDDVEVSQIFKNFICISLKTGSNEARQFSQLYPVLVIPAIFLIGLQGAPLEVIGGVVEKEEIITRANNALELLNKEANPSPQPQPTVSASPPAPVQPAAAVEEVKPTEDPVEDTQEGAHNSQLPLEARVERANQLIAAARAKKAEEEKEKEKAKERERRELGKQLQKLKETQKERELQELAEARQKERREEREARERIRQQIAQDRADRAAKYQAAKESEEERKRAAQTAQEQLQQERASAARSAFSRIQFRLPDGSTRTEQFSSDVKLSDVKAFIDAEIKPSFNPYTLCTTFPRREFTASNMSETLRDLELTPSAALLIVPPTSRGSRPSGGNQAGSWFATIFSPLQWIWTWLMAFFFTPAPQTIQGQPANEQPNQPQPLGGARRRRPDGNVRRVVDSSGADSSDDNATWNGNSTQQL